jgi:hypothetical protein
MHSLFSLGNTKTAHAKLVIWDCMICKLAHKTEIEGVS